MTRKPLPATALLVTASGSRTRRGLHLPGAAWAGLCTFLAFVAAAVFAPLLTPYDPTARVAAVNLPPSAAHWLGTTANGNDVFSQLVYGGRTSLTVGLAAAVITTALALLIGLWAAYSGGAIDGLLSLLTNVFLVIPVFALIVLLAAFLPAGPLSIVFVISVTGWSFGARVFRSQALTLRERDFVLASELVGESRTRIVFVEILPNMWSIVAAFFVNQVVFAVTTEASLEFLGLGDSKTVSWGTMLFWAQNSSALLLGAWWEFVVPGVAIALTAFSLALLNFAVDEQTNPLVRAARLVKSATGYHAADSTLATPVLEGSNAAR